MKSIFLIVGFIGLIVGIFVVPVVGVYILFLFIKNEWLRLFIGIPVIVSIGKVFMIGVSQIEKYLHTHKYKN